MNCRCLIHELSNYIDEDLDPVLKQELERHLEHCEDCAMIVDQTKKTIQILLVPNLSSPREIAREDKPKANLTCASSKRLDPRHVLSSFLP